MKPIWVSYRQDLMRVARLVGKPEGFAPNLREHTKAFKEGKARYHPEVIIYHVSPLKRQWVLTVTRLGLKPARDKRCPTPKAIVEDLRRVAVMTGAGPNRMPKYGDYVKHGSFNRKTVIKKLAGQDGSWAKAGRMVGMRAFRPWRGMAPKDLVIDQYQRLAKKLRLKKGDWGPTKRQYEQEYGYSGRGAFATWNELVRAAGYEPRPAGKPPRKRHQTRVCAVCRKEKLLHKEFAVRSRKRLKVCKECNPAQ